MADILSKCLTKFGVTCPVCKIVKSFVVLVLVMCNAAMRSEVKDNLHLMTNLTRGFMSPIPKFL